MEFILFKFALKSMTTNNFVTNTDRERIVRMYESQIPVSEISRVLNIKRTTVHEIIKKIVRTEEILARTRGVKPSKFNDEQKMSIKGWVDEDCTISLRNIVSKIQKILVLQLVSLQRLEFWTDSIIH